jgi:Ca-activated chloride channel family protein
MKHSHFLPGRKRVFSLVVALVSILGGISLIGGQALAEGSASQDKTLSPYFFVNSDDSSVDRLPLKSTSVSADISGIIADVVVTQVYKNEGKKTIEAVYVFPASTRASVYGMKTTIGERTITAKVLKRDEARRTYEQAKKENKTASLLEQERPNVFRMNVANILPGDVVKTELRYTETIVPTDGLYEFVYPTVVGPRYSNQPSASAPASENWSQNPYLHEGEASPYSFDIKARVAATVPIKEMSCPSHKTTISFQGKSVASMDLDPGEHSGGNRDFILRYRLAGPKIESGLLLYQGHDENFFLLTAEPPKRVTAESIPPREYIFIVDVSGSMSGFPLEISKKLITELLTGLRPTDIFNVMTFSGGSALFSDHSVPATPDHIRGAVALLRMQNGGGGTELLPALRRALALPGSEGFARTVVIATDGYVTVEPAVFDLIGAHLGKANIFPFGIGTAVNRYLIEGMARVGAGEPFVVSRPEEAPAMAEKFREYVKSPVLTHIKLGFDGFQAYDVEPSGVPDMFAERSVVVYGKWKGAPRGTITLTGLSGHRKWEKRIDVSGIKPLTQNSALRYLWARSRVTRLSDYNSLQATEKRTQEITALGLRYNLLTAFTSFVAIDEHPRGHDGSAVTVKQPLPLPMGVTDSALPGERAAGRAMFSPRPRGYSSSVGSFPARSSAPTYAMEHAKKGGFRVERRPKLVIATLKVTKGLSEEEVRRVVERNLPQLPGCFSGQHAFSRLTLEWTIKGNGKIADVRVSSPDSLGKDVSGCVGARLKKWSFPAPQEGRSVHVVMTVELN